MDEFFLSSEIPISVSRSRTAFPDHWMVIAHSGIARPALVLVAGDSVSLPPIKLSLGTRTVVRYGAAHQDLSSDGAELLLELTDEFGHTFRLASLEVSAGSAGFAPRQALIDLGPWASNNCSLKLTCGPGRRNESSGDWIAIYDVAIGSEERLGALRAMAFRKERTANEIAHFANVYQHPMYHDNSHSKSSPQPHVECITLDSLAATQPALPPVSRRPLLDIPDDLAARFSSAHGYAHHLLSSQLKTTAPDFAAKLINLCEQKTASVSRPLRVLSLCAGAARIEAELSARTSGRSHWTLLDISSDLLRCALANFPAGQEPRLIQGDVNEVRDFGERYDVVMCVSGLHHVVELERVLSFCRDVLTNDGEFWSIGEAIGRSGNRLFSDDYRAANEVFRALPQNYRHNRNTGRIDTDLPNVDFSDATFEGIRSDEIEPLLFHWFEPIHVYRRNCFLWRLIDLAYADNYDLAKPVDVQLIHTLVDAEIRHFRQGGRPTELHGTFRKRLL